MNREKEQVYELEIPVSDLNETHGLKPYGYQKLFAQAADRHLEFLDLSVDQTMKYGLAWALISLSLEVVRPVRGVGKLYARTWYSQKKGPYFRREMEMLTPQGETAINGVTYSVLLDLEKRSIYRGKELPFPLDPPVEEFLIEATPSFKKHAKVPIKQVEERIVRGSYLDCLGHVNNCRYGEFCYDALSQEEQNCFSDIRRMDFYFLSELRRDDRFVMGKGYTQGGEIFLQGENRTKEDVAFTALFRFAQEGQNEFE